MIVQRVGQRIISIGGPVYTMPRSAAVAVPWYLSGGIAAVNCLAAYTPKGALNLLSSYDNNAAPGNGLPDGAYDAAPGVAPTHDPAIGWTFNGSTQYLTTGVTPASGWSMILRFSGANTGSAYGEFAGSQNTTGNRRFYLAKNVGPLFWYGNGGYIGGSAFVAAAVIAIAGQQGYLNGVADGATTAAWDTPNNAYPMFIGANNINGVPLTRLAYTCVAAAVYNTVLTAPQVAAVSAAMAAL